MIIDMKVLKEKLEENKVLRQKMISALQKIETELQRIDEKILLLQEFIQQDDKKETNSIDNKKEKNPKDTPKK